MRPIYIHTEISSRQNPEKSLTGDSILRTLAYFDIFHYPLRIEEIVQFLDKKIRETELHAALQTLLDEKKVFLYNGLYMLHDNSLLAHRRKEGNKRAEKLLTKAVRIGQFLQQFPFVRGVGISGSLSKNYADQKADIDFFIITAANRLWLARTFMHLFKKLTYITGSQHYYCMNYYLDEKALQLETQNIFTATELKTLIPVGGPAIMEQFFSSNEWASGWLPACPNRFISDREQRVSWVKSFCEWILGSPLGDRLDDYLMRTTTRRWHKKELKGYKNEKGMTMGLVTGKHFARSNPGAFQEKVLDLYDQKLRELQLGNDL